MILRLVDLGTLLCGALVHAVLHTRIDFRSFAASDLSLGASKTLFRVYIGKNVFLQVYGE